MRRRAEQYNTMYEQAGAEHPFFADWDQNPEGGKAVCGPCVPVLLTHHFVVSHRKQRRLTPRESFAFQGVHVFPQTAGHDSTSPLMEAVARARLTAAQQRTLAGNGLHIPSWHAWFLYILSNTVKVSAAHTPAAWHYIPLGDSDDDLRAVDDEDDDGDNTT